MIGPGQSPLRLTCAATILAVAGILGCGDKRETAEEHRRLSLRLEHVPLRRAAADEPVELRATIQSSLEGPRLEAWVRVLGDDKEERVSMRIGSGGEATATLPARPRGAEIRYVIEAQDAAGLVVTLPEDAENGDFYLVRIEGRSWRVLGGISSLAAFCATCLFLGAGLAGVQCLRGQMSAGPSGMLGGLAILTTIFGLFLIGGIHAFQVAGKPWPDSPVLFSLSRGDLALVSLFWALNLVLGRKSLLDPTPDGRGERGFAAVSVAAGVILLLLLLF
jgi:hypothetical protein